MKSGDIKSFEDLETYKCCKELRIKISDTIKNFPKDEKYNIIDQFKRSSNSVTLNIAEGYGRFHYKENIQFCRQSRGSLYEIMELLNISLDEGYLEKNLYEELRGLVCKCLRLLNGYINMLLKKIKSRK